MRTIAASEFKARCLSILDDVHPEGIVITKRGKPVARLLPMEPAPANHGHFIGILEGKVIADENDDFLSTGAWVSEEWGDLNVEP
jgi:prevent-host-death family protein